MNKSITPDRILLIIKFGLMDTKKRAGVQNQTRRCIMNLDRSSIRIPKKITEVMQREVILPMHFALIKEPKTIEIGGKRTTSNVAVGAIGIYYYTGSLDLVGKTINSLKQICDDIVTNRIKEYNWGSYTIYIAEES